MAKKANNKKGGKRNAGTTPAPPSLWKLFRQGELKRYVKEQIGNYAQTDNLVFIAGVCVLCISVYLIISFVSNIFTGRIDQSYVQYGSLTHAANYGGKLGAILSNYFLSANPRIYVVSGHKVGGRLSYSVVEMVPQLFNHHDMGIRVSFAHHRCIAQQGYKLL